MMDLRVGIDVGGTFTDIVIYDPAKDEFIYYKTPTTPADPSIGIMNALIESATEINKIRLLIVSTTIVTNAIVTGNLPEGALITTKGFRDVLEIRRGTREDIWDHYKDPAPPPIKRRNRFEVNERIDYSGKIVKSIDLNELRRIISIIKKRGIRSIAIVYINSYMNPLHEELTKKVIEEEYPEAFVSASYEVNPEIFEFERTSTTVLNALSMPITKNFVEELLNKLYTRGFKGSLLMFHSGGGTMTPEASIKYAIRLAGAGPAAGVIGAKYICEYVGYKNIITLDSGGTTALVSLIHDGRVRMKKEWWITFGYPIRFPAPDVVTIGAGGGSVAWIDEAGSLRVGPMSMGADPGPACYGRGGNEPTLTDANVVLRRISKENFLGGRMIIYPELSEKIIAEKIAKKLGISVVEAAEGIVNVAAANMANAVRLVSIARGYDPREFVMIAFGGSGPLHAPLIAKDLGIPEVLIPRWPGIVSALGALISDVRHDIMKTYIRVLDEDIAEDLEQQYIDLESRMIELLHREGFDENNIFIQREADMRYVGQWRSLTISMPKPIDHSSIITIIEKFHTEHEREYNYSDRSQRIELYAIRVIGVGLIKKIKLPKIEKIEGSIEYARKGYREVYYQGSYMKFDIYDREKLKAGASIEGPAIIEQMDTTTLIPPNTIAIVDEYGNILIRVR
jgi:N-methylhydantoinase A